MSKKAQLTEKHWKAIELIAEGKNTVKDIAVSLGWQPVSLYKLIEGHEDMGTTALLFKAEMKKIRRKHAEEIKDILNDNKRKSLRIINGVLSRIEALDYCSNDEATLVVTVLNALNKAPTVEINSTSYSYNYKGMSPEELTHEFNRITSLVRGPSVRGRIQEVRPGSARSLPGDIESGSGHGQEAEAL